MLAEVVADASALVDLLLGNELGDAVGVRLAGHVLHAPAHADAEILSALGCLQRAGAVEPDDVEVMLTRLAAAPIERHPVASLLLGAWSRRHRLRLADALYVELAAARALPLITTDRRLRSVQLVEVVVA
jgi:predicted nucleic acid-binding protein